MHPFHSWFITGFSVLPPRTQVHRVAPTSAPFFRRSCSEADHESAASAATGPEGSALKTPRADLSETIVHRAGMPSASRCARAIGVPSLRHDRSSTTGQSCLLCAPPLPFSAGERPPEWPSSAPRRAPRPPQRIQVRSRASVALQKSHLRRKRLPQSFRVCREPHIFHCLGFLY